jgi:hypothetical protein
MTHQQPPNWDDGGRRHRHIGVLEDFTFWALAALVVALLIAGNWVLA